MLWFPQGNKVRKYKRIREIGRSLTSEMLEVIPKQVLTRAAKDMNILHKGIFVFDSEEEQAFLFDRIIFDVTWNGKTAVEHFEAERGSELSAEKREHLEAMKEAYFSLFEVIGKAASDSLRLSDLLSDNQIELMDINLSSTVPKGAVLAIRVIKIEGICMTSGVAYPFLSEQKDTLISGLKTRQTDRRSQKRRSGKRRAVQRIDFSDPGNYGLYFFRQYKRFSPVEVRMSEEMFE
jgi:hypothetical protein